MTTKNAIERPDIVQDDHLTYLDDLRESGATNMLGARSYILAVFPDLSKSEAGTVLGYWIESFNERHP